MAQLKLAYRKQQGAALAVALVLMVVLTGLAVTLMYNSSLDTKMAHAAVVKKNSLNASLGGADEFVQKAHNSEFDGKNPLTLNSDIAAVDLSIENLSAEGESLIPEPTNCPHMSQAEASDSYIRCNRFQIRATHEFGRNNKASTEIVTGVASQIPGES